MDAMDDMRISDDAMDYVRGAAESLASMWFAEDAGEHDDEAAKWYRRRIDDAVRMGCSRNAARLRATKIARDIYSDCF